MQEHNKIVMIQLDDRAMTGTLEHGQLWEQKIFFKALQQFVDPINNPRYILHGQTDKRFLSVMTTMQFQTKLVREKNMWNCFEQNGTNKSGKQTSFTDTFSKAEKNYSMRECAPCPINSFRQLKERVLGSRAGPAWLKV